MIRSATVLLLATGLCAQEAAPDTGQVLTLSLAEAVRLSARTAGVDLAQLEREVASARRYQERAAWLPNLTGTASWTRRGPVGSPPDDETQPPAVSPSNTVDARLRLTQTVFDWAALVRVSAAREAMRAADAERMAALERAAAAGASSYIALARARALVASRRSDLALAEELAALADAQVKVGVAEAINSTRAATQVISARGDLLVAEGLASRLGIDLERAIEESEGVEIVLATPYDDALAGSTAPRTAAGAVSAAMVQRPELHLVAAQASAAAFQRDAVASERLPTLQLFGEYGGTGPRYDRTSENWAYGLQGSITLFDGYRRDARLDQQEALFRQADRRQTELRAQVMAESRSAVIDLASMEQQRVVARERLRLAELEVSQARDRFRAGVASNIDVINAQLSLSKAHDADIDTLAGLANARVRLARAVGVAGTIR